MESGTSISLSHPPCCRPRAQRAQFHLVLAHAHSDTPILDWPRREAKPIPLARPFYSRRRTIAAAETSFPTSSARAVTSTISIRTPHSRPRRLQGLRGSRGPAAAAITESRDPGVECAVSIRSTGTTSATPAGGARVATSSRLLYIEAEPVSVTRLTVAEVEEKDARLASPHSLGRRLPLSPEAVPPVPAPRLPASEPLRNPPPIMVLSVPTPYDASIYPALTILTASTPVSINERS